MEAPAEAKKLSQKVRNLYRDPVNFRKLYAIEQRIQGLMPDQKTAQRQQLIQPVLYELLRAV